MDIIDKTIEATLNEIDPEKLVPKYNTTKLAHVEPVRNLKGKSRKELYDILDKFSNDKDFGLALLPIDYIASRQPHLWDEKAVGMRLDDFIDYMKDNDELERLNNKQRLSKIEKKLRKKLQDKLNKKIIKEHELQKKLDEGEERKQKDLEDKI